MGWFGFKDTSLKKCAQLVMDHVKCDKRFFNWEKYGNKDCGCVKPGSNCLDGSLFSADTDGAFNSVVIEIMERPSEPFTISKVKDKHKCNQKKWLNIKNADKNVCARAVLDNADC